MSLDLEFKVINCEHCDSCSIYDFNYTYNVTKMWTEATGQEKLVQIEGLTGFQALEILNKGIKELCSKPEHYKQYNPPNGWGDYDSFVEWLTKLKRYCEDNLGGVWSAWR